MPVVAFAHSFAVQIGTARSDGFEKEESSHLFAG